MGTIVERRRYRRADVDVAADIRPAEEPASKGGAITGRVKNVSLAGMYCYVSAPCPLKQGQQVICSVSIPPEQARFFPFTRLMGKGWIARLDPVAAGRRAGESRGEEQVLAMAVAFAPGVSALGSIDL